jgi:hypothetical protein
VCLYPNCESYASGIYPRNFAFSLRSDAKISTPEYPRNVLIKTCLKIHKGKQTKRRERAPSTIPNIRSFKSSSFSSRLRAVNLLLSLCSDWQIKKSLRLLNVEDLKVLSLCRLLLVFMPIVEWSCKELCCHLYLCE